jgi:hypothetical protein
MMKAKNIKNLRARVNYPRAKGLWLEEDPKKRSNWTNDAFEHTSPFGSEKNIKVNKYDIRIFKGFI